jgi:glycosyltransferase involved in cell wall biosynthesis
MRPSVTIAIPTRNRPGYLAAALESAFAAAGPADQVIVSDNASNDGTPAFLATIRDPRVTVLRQTTDVGMVGNWNACLAAANGELFMLLSDDDLVERGAIDRLAPMLDDPAVAFAYGRSRVIDQDGKERTLGHIAPARETLPQFLRAWFGYSRTIYPCATIMRAAELRAAGGYEARFGPFADVGAWLGVWTKAPGRDVVFSPDVVAAYRSHEAALSTGDLEGGVAGLRALQSSFRGLQGVDADSGFDAMAAHYVASALRRRAGGTSMPVIEYLGLMIRNVHLVLPNWGFDAYWRQAEILADPAGYEREKQRRAAEAGKPQ